MLMCNSDYPPAFSDNIIDAPPLMYNKKITVMPSVKKKIYKCLSAI
jgi:hypothetical protein